MSAQVSQIETRAMSRKRRADEELAAARPKRAVPVPCLLCGNSDACVVTARCQHINYCLPCFHASGRWRRRHQTCERCAVEVWEYFGRDDSAAAERGADLLRCEAPDVVEHVEAGIRLMHAAHCTVDELVTMVLRLFLRHRQFSKFPLLAVDACERLLVECDRIGVYKVEGGGKMRNVLVSLCRYPWKVDVNVGSHGVCYHGNMGQVANVGEALRVLETNIRFITGLEQYY